MFACHVLDGLDKPKWLAERRTRISSSDIPIILGLGYKGWTPAKLAEIKLGITGEMEASERMQLGTVLEPEAVRRWERKHGRETSRAPSLCVNKERPWQSATPDRLIDGFRHLLEAKVIFDYPDDEWGEDGSARIPEKHVCQTTWQMDTVGGELCDVTALFVPHEQRSYQIEYDAELAEMLRAAGLEFYEFINSEGVPPPDWRPEVTADVMGKCLSVRPWECRELTAAEEEAAREYKRYKEVIKEAEEEAEKLKAKILQAAGDASDCTFPGGGYLTRKKVCRGSYEVKACEYYTFNLNLNPKKKRR